MPRRTTLHIDVDDTIIAQILTGAGLELRPCVMTQLTVLGKLYDCCWLTSWPHIEPEAPNLSTSRGSIATLMSCLYGNTINETFRDADWDRNHGEGKAEFVLSEERPRTGIGLKTLYSKQKASRSTWRENWIATSA